MYEERRQELIQAYGGLSVDGCQLSVSEELEDRLLALDEEKDRMLGMRYEV
jgi:hypothetical protein